MGALKHTPLFAAETADGAKMAPVRNWSLPAYYPGGALAEYRHTRNGCSLFDLSHLDKFRIAGADAAAVLERALTVPCAALETGECRHGFALNEQGGVVGELFVHRMAEEDFFVTASAGSLPFLESGTSEVQDLSASLAVIALCGPGAEKILRALGEETVVLPGENRHTMLALDDFRSIASRITFSGLPEYRFFCRADVAAELREFFLESPGIRPAGATAREMLRIGAGVPAFPDELDLAHTPPDCGLELDCSREFTGAAALRNEKPCRQLQLVKFDGRRFPPPGAKVFASSGEELGRVTSGAFSPEANAALAFCDLDAAFPAPAGAVLTVKSAAETFKGVVTAPPITMEK